MFFQPCPDSGVILRTVVIQNHVDSQAIGGFPFGLQQKLPEFEVPMPWVTRTDDLALQHVQRRKQASGPVAFGIMRHRPTTSFLHRHPRLSSIQGLYLRFLINSKNNSLVCGVEVYSYHIGQLFDKPLIFRKLKCFNALQLQALCISNREVSALLTPMAWAIVRIDQADAGTQDVGWGLALTAIEAFKVLHCSSVIDNFSTGFHMNPSIA